MTIDASAIRLKRDSGHGRYSYAFPDGAEAEMSYAERQPGIVAITHTYTPSQHRGKGTAAALVARAVADFRDEGLKVVPACWFAREQFEEHPEWRDLLADG
jgi:predicted GNAT family acetyltransferase